MTQPAYSQDPLFQHGPLQEAFAALRRDLIHEGGPSISTMRNYRFAIVQYDPAAEFRLRGEVQHLTSDLAANGWQVISVSLQKLFLDRVRRRARTGSTASRPWRGDWPASTRSAG